jgi:hypothetical protein
LIGAEFGGDGGSSHGGPLSQAILGAVIHQ